MLLRVAILAFLCLFFVTVLCPENAEAAPGRRSKSRSSSGSSWFGSKKKNTYQQSGGWNNNNGYKKKGSTMKTLKKAAVIGAVAYGGYQLGKLSSGYNSWGWGRSHGYGFNDWNRWREIDGFMCRSNQDCNWMDPRLYCQDYELNFRPSALWFGGDAASIVGECACPRGMLWDDYDMQCRAQMFGTFGIVGLVVGLVIFFGCCCCGIYAVRKFFF